ncbi:MAG: alpha-hydroxy acid oxidase [Ferrimicrobium sp.]
MWPVEWPVMETGSLSWLRRDCITEAREVLSEESWGYFFGGSAGEITLVENRSAWSQFRLVPSILPAGAGVDTSVDLLGMVLPSPLVVAPVAAQSLIDEAGEPGLAFAAGLAGVSYTISSRSSRSIERIGEAFRAGMTIRVDQLVDLDPGHALWVDRFRLRRGTPRLFLQLYMMNNLNATSRLVHMGQEAGVEAMVVTLDTPYLGLRYRDLDTGFNLRAELERVLAPADRDGPVFGFGFGDTEIAQAQWFDPGAVHTVLDGSTMPVIGKGILGVHAASRWRGVVGGGLWISNHGGRQLDRVRTSARALEIVGADPRFASTPLVVDGGVHGAHDVVVACSLGARLVGVARSVIAAFAVGGVVGAASYLIELQIELEHALGLLGVEAIAALVRDHLDRG